MCATLITYMLPTHFSLQYTVNKVCSSGLKSVMMAAQAIEGGHQSIIVAGGMESMSNVPYYLPKQRFGSKYGDVVAVDGLRKDGLSDAYGKYAMGVCAEKCARDYNIDRKAQDAYTAESYRRSQFATRQGLLSSEIVPVTIKTRKGTSTVAEDEEVFRLKDMARIGKARPAFQKKDGTVTAASASTISDGAAAVVLMSGRAVQARGLTPVARIVAYCDAAQAPDDFTTAPTLAIKKLLAKTNMTVDDVDVWEINEAFSVVAIANQRLLDIPSDKLNVLGGSVSIGHPLGASGTRILTTLLSALRYKKGRYGVAGICNGGGGASCLMVELLPASPSFTSKL
jgi:acetyl-CoA C-acetyltransferase